MSDKKEKRGLVLLLSLITHHLSLTQMHLQTTPSNEKAPDAAAEAEERDWARRFISKIFARRAVERVAPDALTEAVSDK